MPKDKLSRRDFARTAALAAATAALVPSDLVAQEQKTEPKQPGPEKKPKLPPELQAEAETRIDNLMRQYGSRLSDEQKAEVRKNITEGMEGVGKLRAFPLDNSVEPATVLHLVRSGR